MRWAVGFVMELDKERRDFIDVLLVSFEVVADVDAMAVDVVVAAFLALASVENVSGRLS